MAEFRLAIETGIEPEYENALQDSARAIGWGVDIVQNIPFTDQFIAGDFHGSPLPETLLQDPQVWFHGSFQAAKRAVSVTGWKVDAPWDQLRCESYYALLGERLLQRDHIFTTLAAFQEQKDDLFASDLVEDGSLFVRPDGNDKVFTGGCITLDDFHDSYNLMTFYDPDPTTKIVVARPQRIKSEARFLIVDGKLVTGSLYKAGGQSIRLEAHAKLMGLAEDYLGFCLGQGFNPALSWVLDLAETSEGWSIIEVGASSCCGMYKCDTLAFMQALDKALRENI